jgi:beta-N-acetylhexosaminidase
MVDLRGNPFSLSDTDIQWVNDTLANLSIEEKIGQLFCSFGLSKSRKALLGMVGGHGVGGVMLNPSKSSEMADAHAFLQANSKLPLLIAGNLENGGAGATSDGTNFGMPMLAAATGKPVNGYRLGAVSCGEGAALGFNWAFAPVVDLNLNFRNPIANVRAFGEDPDTVIAFAKEYLRAADECGVAACAKHFPGDGADERDQHLLTSVNDLYLDEWDKSYGRIYKALIEAGVRTIMAGHIAMPAYQEDMDEPNAPASLSKALMAGLLRRKLGFNGLITTDASSMAGFRTYMKREDAVPYAIANGADMLLFNRPEDMGYLLSGLKRSIVAEERLNEAVTRVLALKASLKLHEKPRYAPKAEPLKANRERNGAWAKECADDGITIVKDTQGLLPISASKYKRLYLNVLEDDDSLNTPLRRKLKALFEREGFEVKLRDRSALAQLNTIASPGASPLKKALALLKARGALAEPRGPVAGFLDSFDLAVYVANFEPSSKAASLRINWRGLKGLGNDLPWFAAEKPVMFISLASPYHLLDAPMIKTFINAYSSNSFALEALAGKLLGRSPFKGVSPVDASCGKKGMP